MQQPIPLPPRPFLYTLDQIAVLVSIEINSLKRTYLHFDGRHTGPVPRKKMKAHNIAPDGKHPDWRVSEAELRRWLRACGFRVYDRTTVV